MADPIYNSEDVIDSRDIIERVEELENDVSVLQDEINGMESEFKELVRDDDQEKRDELGSNIDNSKDEIEDINDELKPLRLLMTDGENYNSDFHSGATLINNDYFEDYAYELACDIGAVDRISTGLLLLMH